MIKNPLIPMGAITGNLTAEQIKTMLRRYADMGIQQFLLYPRDGCEVIYMSDRWLEICGDIIRTADSLGMDIWLYDEYNWPSGTCRGAVMEDNPEFIARCIIAGDGKCEIIESVNPGRIPIHYADILNPDAVDCFISKTHEVYYRHFGKYFGRVIKGIFTDEPAMLYFMSKGSQYPYTKGLEEIYKNETERDLFADILDPTDEFRRVFHRLLSRLFRENYIDRISDWCKSHNIQLTGHLMSESNLTGSLRSCGDAVNALRGFGIPGMDEISTRTEIDQAEWLTFGVLQAAIRETGNGGLAEVFALGPTDLPPSRVEQMIWLEAMFGVDKYVLAVSAADARGNVLKNGWFNPMNYMNPWFAGYPELGVTATIAASYAKKTVKPEVFVRYPLTLSIKHLPSPEKQRLLNDNIYAILKALTRAQYQWQLLGEEDPAPRDAFIIELTDADDFPVENIIAGLQKNLPKRLCVLGEDGEYADNLLLREYTDGSAVILDLADSPQPRKLTICRDGKNSEILLDGRGHYVIGDEIPRGFETISEISPEFRLLIDRPNTLRCNLRSDKLEYSFTVADRLESIRLLVRDYVFDGEISLDGISLNLTRTADALTPGLAELYRSTEPFTLLSGVHTIRASVPAKSEPFLPSCFVCGSFASDNTDTLRALPEKTGTGRIDADVLPQFAGKIKLEASIKIPNQACQLTFDSSDLYTRVFINGIPLGGRLSGYRWNIPEACLGMTALVRIEQFTSIGPIFGRANDAIANGEGEKWVNVGKWFPRQYQKCGVTNVKFIKPY